MDAIGKPQSGLFQGNTGWLGPYSECTETIPDAHYYYLFPKLDSTGRLKFYRKCFSGQGMNVNRELP